MTFETPAPDTFTPPPAHVNPFRAMDPEWVEKLVESRGLCPPKRDPFLADE